MSESASTKWISQAEAAEYLGVTDRTIRLPIAQGQLLAYRILKTPPYRSVVTWEHPLTLRKMGVKAPRMDGWKFYQIPDDPELINSEYRTHRTLPHLRPISETSLITSTCRCAGWQFPEVSVLNDLADKVDKRDFTPPAREPEFE